MNIFETTSQNIDFTIPLYSSGANFRILELNSSSHLTAC